MQKHSGEQIDENSRRVKLVHTMRSDREATQKPWRKLDGNTGRKTSRKQNNLTKTRGSEHICCVSNLSMLPSKDSAFAVFGGESFRDLVNLVSHC